MKNGTWQEEESLFTALGLTEQKQEVISVVGAGGKTTILRRLQKECMQKKVPHIVSTTTHMQYENDQTFLGHPSLRMLQEIFMRSHTVWMGEAVSEWKMKGFSHAFLRKVKDLGYWLLLEADGSKHLPIKAPRCHEPVILEGTTTVVNVYGMDSIGKKIQDTCFGVEEVCNILGKDADALLTEEDIVVLASNSKAGKKQVTNWMKYHVILNKADTKEEQKVALRIAQNLQKQGVIFVHQTSNLIEKV